MNEKKCESQCIINNNQIDKPIENVSKEILFWLMVKWVTEVNKIIEERWKKWKYISLLDFINRVNVDKKIFDWFFYAWAFKSILWKDYLLKYNVNELKDFLETWKKIEKINNIISELKKTTFKLNEKIKLNLSLFSKRKKQTTKKKKQEINMWISLFWNLDIEEKWIKNENLSLVTKIEKIKKRLNKLKNKLWNKNIFNNLNIFSIINNEQNIKKIIKNKNFIEFYTNNFSLVFFVIIKKIYNKILLKELFNFEKFFNWSNINKKEKQILFNIIYKVYKKNTNFDFNKIKKEIQENSNFKEKINYFKKIIENEKDENKQIILVKNLTKELNVILYNEIIINQLKFKISIFFDNLINWIWEKIIKNFKNDEKIQKEWKKIIEKLEKNNINIKNELEKITEKNKIISNLLEDIKHINKINEWQIKKDYLNNEDLINNLNLQKNTIWFVDYELIKEILNVKWITKNIIDIKQFNIFVNLRNEWLILNEFKKIFKDNYEIKETEKYINEKQYLNWLKLLLQNLFLNFLDWGKDLEKLQDILKLFSFNNDIIKTIKYKKEFEKNGILLNKIWDITNSLELNIKKNKYWNKISETIENNKDVIRKIYYINVLVNKWLKFNELEIKFEKKFNNSKLKQFLEKIELDENLDLEFIKNKLEENLIIYLENLSDVYDKYLIKLKGEFDILWYIWKEKYYFDKNKLVLFISNWWTITTEIYLWDLNEKLFNVKWIWKMSIKKDNFFNEIKSIYFKKYFYNKEKLNITNNIDKIIETNLFKKIKLFLKNWFNNLYPFVTWWIWKEENLVNWYYLINLWRNKFLWLEFDWKKILFNDWFIWIEIEISKLNKILDYIKNYKFNEKNIQNPSQSRKKFINYLYRNNFIKKYDWNFYFDFETKLNKFSINDQYKTYKRSISYFDEDLEKKFYNLYLKYYKWNDILNETLSNWILIYDIETFWHQLMISYYNIITKNWYKIYFHSPKEYNYKELNFFQYKTNNKEKIILFKEEKNFFYNFNFIELNHNKKYLSVKDFHYTLNQKEIVVNKLKTIYYIIKNSWWNFKNFYIDLNKIKTEKEKKEFIIRYFKEIKLWFENENFQNELINFLINENKLIWITNLIDDVIHWTNKISWHNIKHFDNNYILDTYINEKHKKITFKKEDIKEKLDESSIDTYEMFRNHWSFWLDSLIQLNFMDIKKTLKKHGKETLIDIIANIHKLFVDFRKKYEIVIDEIFSKIKNLNEENLFIDEINNDYLIIDKEKLFKNKNNFKNFIKIVENEDKIRWKINFQYDTLLTWIIKDLWFWNSENFKELLLSYNHILDYSDKILNFVIYNKNDVLMSTALLWKILKEKEIVTTKWLIKLDEEKK